MENNDNKNELSKIDNNETEIKKDNLESENKEIKNEEKKENKENKEKDDSKEKNNNDKKEDEKIDPHLIFQKELLNIISKQEKILSATSTINEKFDVSNQITKEQIASFKTSIDKYGKYLLMIKKELGLISETMKKIKKLSKENQNK